jgi:hypothetical protein
MMGGARGASYVVCKKLVSEETFANIRIFATDLLATRIADTESN